MHSLNVLLTQYNFWKLIILFYLDNNFDISQHYSLSSKEFTVINMQKRCLQNVDSDRSLLKDIPKQLTLERSSFKMQFKFSEISMWKVKTAISFLYNFFDQTKALSNFISK